MKKITLLLFKINFYLSIFALQCCVVSVNQSESAKCLYISVGGVCNFSILSHHSKNLKWQTRVTAQFYLASKGQYILEVWGKADPKEAKRKEKRSILAPLFMSFLLPLTLPYINWANQEGFLFHLMFSLQSSDLPLLYFHGLYPVLSSSHCILNSFFLFQLPNIPHSRGPILSE